MKIPKEILKAIHNVEELGQQLAIEEKVVYNWIEKHGINPEDGWDNELDFLFHSHDGSDLIKRLEEL